MEIATTRPETMLGDTAVAVHPEDNRYQHVIGKTVILPLVQREIPVISDEYVDREFGTGALKVTPAHDPNDYELGLRHNLPQINIFNSDGTLNQFAGSEYQGMDRFDCRQALVENLRDSGLLMKAVPHPHSVGHHDRCDTIVEPYLSLQWFINVNLSRNAQLKPSETARLYSFPNVRRNGFITGWRTFCRGQFRVSAGGDTDCQFGIAAIAERSLQRSKRLKSVPAAVETCAKKKTCWTHGSVPGYGRFRQWVGPNQPLS